MIKPADHPREAERLALLASSGMLNSPAEPDFDGLVSLAASIAGTPIALVSLVDEQRQWFKARFGLEAQETPLEVAFCAHAILNSGPLVVEDAHRDPRFHDNPLVTGGPRVAFYAGVPLCAGPDRLPLGTLCVIDHQARSLSPERMAQLTLLARQAERLIELRLQQHLIEERLVAVRMSEERLNTILATMDEGLVVQNRGGAITSCNPAAERLLGLTADQIMGRSSTDPRWRTVHEDGLPFSGQDHPAMVVLRTGKAVQGKVMGVELPSGDRRWILINSQAVGDAPEGLPETVVTTFADITALRREETERRRVEKQVEAFFNVSLDLLCIANSEGQFLRLNPAWTTVLGWSIDELLSRPFFDLVHPEDLERTVRVAARLGNGGETVGFQNRYRCKNGTWRTLEWVAAGVPGQSTIMAVARDITESLAREAELTRAKEAAEAAVRAKSEFLATMSHEIRTPMNGVLGVADVLLGTEPLSDDQRELLNLIQDSGRSLLTIINDILDWSRIEAGRVELTLEDVDASKVVRDVVAVLAAQAKAKGLILAVEIDPQAPDLVRADPDRLRQVLINLIGNAIKFTSQGRVVVHIGPAESGPGLPDGGCQIAITDTGIGIPADRIEKLFQRFSQVDASTTRRFGGSGLGLAISRSLTLLMGGTIEVASRLGQGSTFTVILQTATAVVRKHPAKAQPAPASHVPLRILLVEDNPVNQMVALALLARDGHLTTTAGNGNEAMAAYRTAGNQGFDAVLMDVQMPEMDGIEATRSIRAFELAGGLEQTPVLALTASAMPEERADCLAAGMDEVLTKPISLVSLRLALASISAKRR